MMRVMLNKAQHELVSCNLASQYVAGSNLSFIRFWIAAGLKHLGAHFPQISSVRIFVQTGKVLPVLLFMSGKVISVVSDRFFTSAFPRLFVFEVPAHLTTKFPFSSVHEKLDPAAAARYTLKPLRCLYAPSSIAVSCLPHAYTTADVSARTYVLYRA